MNIKQGTLFLSLACVALSMKAGENNQAPVNQVSPAAILIHSEEGAVSATPIRNTPVAPITPEQPSRLRNSRSPGRQRAVPLSLRDRAILLERHRQRSASPRPSSGLRNVSRPNPDANPGSQAE